MVQNSISDSSHFLFKILKPKALAFVALLVFSFCRMFIYIFIDRDEKLNLRSPLLHTWNMQGAFIEFSGRERYILNIFSWNWGLLGFDWVLMCQENLFAVGFDWVLFRSIFAVNLFVDLVQTHIPILLHMICICSTLSQAPGKNGLLSICGKCKSQIVPRKWRIQRTLRRETTQKISTPYRLKTLDTPAPVVAQLRSQGRRQACAAIRNGLCCSAILHWSGWYSVHIQSLAIICTLNKDA